MRVPNTARRVIPLLIVVAVAGVGYGLYHRTRSKPPSGFADAVAALKSGHVDRVVEIQRVLEADPAMADEARLLRGGLLLRDRKYAEALREMSSISPRGDLAEPYLEFTGECLYGLGRLAEAEARMRQLVALKPDHVDAHRWLGAIYFDLGANDLARREFATVIRLAPHDFRPHWLTAEMYFDFEQYSEATKHFRMALELKPKPAVREVIARKLARSLMATREFQSALQVLSDVTPDAESLALQSECHWSLGERDAADAALKHARERNPESRSVEFLYTRMLIGDGMPRKAVAPLKRLLQRDPHDVECRYQLALAYRRLKETENADRELARWRETKALREQLTKLNQDAINRPRDADVRDELATICRKLGKLKLAADWRRAAEECRKLRTRSPAD